MKPQIAVSQNIVAIETPYAGCWRVTVNKKPVADWCNRQDAERDAHRRGWRPDGKPGQPATMINSRPACFVNTREDGIVLQSLGPVLKFA